MSSFLTVSSSIPFTALIISLILSLLILCICGALLFTRGDPWESEMGVETGAAIDPQSINGSTVNMEDGSRHTSLSSIPSLDEKTLADLVNDPSGGLVLDRMDRATAEALAVQRVLEEESISSSINSNLSLPQPTQVRVIASRRDFL